MLDGRERVRRLVDTGQRKGWVEGNGAEGADREATRQRVLAEGGKHDDPARERGHGLAEPLGVDHLRSDPRATATSGGRRCVSALPVAGVLSSRSTAQKGRGRPNPTRSEGARREGVPCRYNPAAKSRLLSGRPPTPAWR